MKVGTDHSISAAKKVVRHYYRQNWSKWQKMRGQKAEGETRRVHLTEGKGTKSARSVNFARPTPGRSDRPSSTSVTVARASADPRNPRRNGNAPRRSWTTTETSSGNEPDIAVKLRAVCRIIISSSRWLRLSISEVFLWWKVFVDNARPFNGHRIVA